MKKIRIFFSFWLKREQKREKCRERKNNLFLFRNSCILFISCLQKFSSQTISLPKHTIFIFIFLGLFYFHFYISMAGINKIPLKANQQERKVNQLQLFSCYYWLVKFHCVFVLLFWLYQNLYVIWVHFRFRF